MKEDGRYRTIKRKDKMEKERLILEIRKNAQTE
jgi:hypothetical protein